MTDPVGTWEGWNATEAPTPYADTETYALGAAWLADCALVEDWGCGRGWLRTLIPPARYRGIDGSSSPHADEVVDLREYRSKVPGVFMRHVLEHNHEWARILDNAVASFTERMALILFTPLAEETKVIGDGDVLAVPDISFSLADLVPRFRVCSWESETLATPSQYGTETAFYLEKT